MQQLNHKHLDTLEYDSNTFFAEDSMYTQVYILTQLPEEARTTTADSVRDYLLKAEKCLYYTLDKVNFRERLHPSTAFYFADASDTLMTTALARSQQDFVALYV